MTLEEAIRHAEEVAQKNEDFVRCHSCDRELGFVKRCQKCAEEHRQLAEWLKELKAVRDEIDDAADEDEIFNGTRCHAMPVVRHIADLKARRRANAKVVILPAMQEMFQFRNTNSKPMPGLRK